MTAQLMVQIDGKTLPLSACCWVQTTACGCICSVLTAAWGNEAFATEEQAHKHLVPLKRERDREVKRGFTMTLITLDDYKARYGDPAAWRCPHSKGGAA